MSSVKTLVIYSLNDCVRQDLLKIKKKQQQHERLEWEYSQKSRTHEGRD